MSLGWLSTMLAVVQNVHNALLTPGLNQIFNFIRQEQILMSLSHLQSQKAAGFTL